METYRLLGEPLKHFSRPAVAVGNFDGVHRGHEALVASAVGIAAARGADAVVLTFDPHPARVVAPESAPAALMTLDQKAAALERLGAAALAVLPFTAEVAREEPDVFASTVLRSALDAGAVVVGDNFRFGRGRAGDAGTLRGLGFDVIEVPPVLHGGERVSSSRIRRALAEGDVALAAALLGRPFLVEGTVVRGEGRGRTLGIPTANLAPRNQTLPALGVYAAWGWVPGEGPVRAVVNVGRRPTFGGDAVSVEAHLLDFDRDLYGSAFGLSFVSRIRGEVKFSGPDALVARIREDVAAARRALGARAPASAWDAL
jgi:riboflavin kinase / FMN adenylyltransferase